MQQTAPLMNLLHVIHRKICSKMRFLHKNSRKICGKHASRSQFTREKVIILLSNVLNVVQIITNAFENELI